MLPKMDGYQVARMLKFDEKYEKIPILMLTAKSQEIDKATGYKTGADKYMTKPFEAKKLLETIRNMLEKK